MTTADRLAWRISSRSSTGENGVEVALVADGVATITKIGTDTLVKSLHTAVALGCNAEEWSALLAGAVDGEFGFTGQLGSV